MSTSAAKMSAIVFDNATQVVEWTNAPTDDDIVLHDNVRHKCAGVLIALGQDGNPPSRYDPSNCMVAWKPKAEDGDLVLQTDCMADDQGAIVLRKRKTPPTATVNPPKKTNKEPAAAAAAAEKPLAAQKKSVQLTVLSKGNVRRAYLSKVILTCVGDMDLAASYIAHVQPSGLNKIAFVPSEGEMRVFPTLADCLAHIKAATTIDITAELETNPKRLFPSVLALADRTFNMSTQGVAEEE